MDSSRPIEIKEKLLKDSFNRLGPPGDDVTHVQVDLRKDTHDVITVFIRGLPAGQLVTDKNDSVTIARRLLPESLKYGKEPSTIVKDMERLAIAYGQLLMEVRSAIGHGSVSPLSAYMRKLDAANISRGSLPGDGHLYVPAGMAPSQRESEEHPEAHGSSHSSTEA